MQTANEKVDRPKYDRFFRLLFSGEKLREGLENEKNQENLRRRREKLNMRLISILKRTSKSILSIAKKAWL